MIGIVILNYLSCQDTLTCVSTVPEACSQDYHIYIVDNASPDDSYAKLKKLYIGSPIVTVVASDKNRGYAAGNNMGIKFALADHCENIVLCNSDIVFGPCSIDFLIEYLIKHHDVGITGPRVLFPDGRDQIGYSIRKIGLREKYLHKTVLRHLGIDRRNPLSFSYIPHDPIDVYYVLGCCFAFSIKFAEEVLPLDENTFLFEEELILGIASERAGYRTVLIPEAIVTHRHRGSTRHASAFSMMHSIFSEIYYCRSYLRAPLWKILPLWLTRFFSFFWRSFRSKEYSRLLKRVIIESRERLLSPNGLSRQGGVSSQNWKTW